MHLDPRIFGTYIVAKLEARLHEAVLVIGRDLFTRPQLARVGCFSPVGAANLSSHIASFRVVDTKDVFERISPIALAVPGFGPMSLAVLGCAFEIKGLPNLDAWAKRHLREAPIVTFQTMKAHTSAADLARFRADYRRRRFTVHRRHAS